LNQATQQEKTRRRALIIVAIALALIAGAILVLAMTDSSPPATPRVTDETRSPSPRRNPPPRDLVARMQDAVTLEGVLQHLETFQRIADNNGGNRYTATSGHERSVAYVARVLRNAGYEVHFDRFDVTVYAENAPSVLQRRAPSRAAFEPGGDFTTFNFSPSGSVNGRVTPVAVDLGSVNSLGGCDSNAFSGFPNGDVALVQAGPCTLTEQVVNAQDAGASAALVLLTPEIADTSRGVPRPSLASSDVDVPALAVSAELGSRLARGEVRVHLEVDGDIAERTTRNVIAEQPGRTGDVLMVGAHLDSVADGPGINDNGSGTASILELAVALAGAETTEAVRFAFWSAEELGLVGSDHYVSKLSDADRNRITAYLNFDMVASPNYMRLVYGDNPVSIENPAAIKNLFVDYFAERDLDTELVNLSGRSDHGPFERAGIPVGGLFTGAEMIKDRAAARSFGGVPGAPADPCYHLACDDLDNVNVESLDQMSDAIAFAVATLATSDDL